VARYLGIGRVLAESGDQDLAEAHLGRERSHAGRCGERLASRPPPLPVPQHHGSKSPVPDNDNAQCPKDPAPE
jgi:hypothetical protein